MQNRYTGDIGDFGKLGLMRVLQSSGLTIGVNWYLTPGEKHNRDGRHVEYLENKDFYSCDAALRLELKRIVDGARREVKALQNDRILKASYFSAPLDFSGMDKAARNAFRESWHHRALDALSGVDVVFADPDNGLIVPSAAGTVRENKYVLPKELADYYRQGSSVVYYQHKARRLDSFYIGQHEQLLEKSELHGASGLALKFRTTSQRYYFFIVQPRHQAVISEAMRVMLASAWNRHFSLIGGV